MKEVIVTSPGKKLRDLKGYQNLLGLNLQGNIIAIYNKEKGNPTKLDELSIYGSSRVGVEHVGEEVTGEDAFGGKRASWIFDMTDDNINPASDYHYTFNIVYTWNCVGNMCAASESITGTGTTIPELIQSIKGSCAEYDYPVECEFDGRFLKVWTTRATDRFNERGKTASLSAECLVNNIITKDYSFVFSPGANGTATLSHNLGKKEYELTNHLGNVMTVVSDRKIGIDDDNDGKYDYYVADVISSQDYLPFGMLMPGRNYQADQYRFGFNGKMNDNEICGNVGEFQDYGMREYNTYICRFLSVDPLTSKYPMLTPYQFASNRPIDGVDLDGKEVFIKIGDVPNGKAELRIINSEFVQGLQWTTSVNTYPLIVTDFATNKETVYSVTREALYINNNAKSDAQGNFTVYNTPFEPANGSSNSYEGKLINSFGETGLPSIKLTQNGSPKLAAEPTGSP
ncbi:MAG: RHS repeat-associated core domain-containing protein, partial [Bacteroidota bacterium]|nr:RHS repeat-associated core domain-containing protein [Bacteroidota bacterium]